ncbi:MAG: carboxylating nicotinate-nucleotide diphosphorylase [Bacteroidales bacterium]
MEGSILSILQTERVILNYIQHLSGIATRTFEYAEKIKMYKAKVTDTRKTTPGFRLLQKMAVKAGGGENHRMGLYDMILIKDNHIDYAGGITNALNKTKEYLKFIEKPLKIEIEARNLDEIKEILDWGKVDRILIDNFSHEVIHEAVSLINGRAETEVSGGITLANIVKYAQDGVDYISVGALTHQINSLDMSLKAVKI